MSFSDYEWVAAIIAAHPNRTIVGRTRLQKEVKLLQRLGFPTSYVFNIHYYGPYSDDLQSGIGLLKEFKLISEEEEPNGTGGTYYVFRAKQNIELPDVLPWQSLIDEFARTNSIVLELAATYDAFRELGSDEDEAMVRLRRKKGSKCDNGRAGSALELLRKLGLLQQPIAA